MAELVYEVRSRFASPEVRARYLAWLKDGHVRAVLEGGALDGEVREELDGTIVTRYRFASKAAFAAYEAGAAVPLRAEGKRLFSEGVVMERSTCEIALAERRAPLEVVPVACLSDNYAYLVIDRDLREAVVVDPSEAGPVRTALAELGVSLVAIWCTHHHFDHVGGNEELVREWNGIEVLGSRHDERGARIPGQTRGLDEGEEILFGARSFRALSIPGHTLGALAYLGEGMAFTGDTLFCGGCGRVFEGTMPMMRTSLMRLSGLPDGTRIYAGHEYTVKNLEFAAVVEPGSAAVKARLRAAREAREAGRPSVGTPIENERATNPFLRAAEPSVQAFAAERGAAHDADEVFARVREAKDRF
jgi:hydroxyacylglutathione hydrolase